MAEAKTVKKKKQKKNIISGLAYINATFNNTSMKPYGQGQASLECPQRIHSARAESVHSQLKTDS